MKQTTTLRLLVLATFGALAVPAMAGTECSQKDEACTSVCPSAQPTSYAVGRAGKHVELGSYRVHVQRYFGRPDAVLEDGRWAYFEVGGASLSALPEQDYALILTFNEAGRVAQLKLVEETAFVAQQLSQPMADGAQLAQR